ncbi:MAG TPA: hypothetical protein PL017_07225 [Tenuifilaceae bacterium]|nr:hypothetical protein [Tenuifilaceae bacterium]HPE17145.1 hypothetical protein [Tenuifilaceae bacterium]HPJ45873.1 hypothetical protein [Tenuifilaceae bacterium]HPQ34096.1 hypothetical protein [Tenuifilaceae bacterium]HRX68733.1 hypothetical protein [Tenuifilaceae bacterium]
MGRTNTNKNKNFDSFSIKEVVEIFTLIDEQIIELHKCSSDDFLGLNAYFKQYYKHSKTISANAKEVLQSLTDSKSGNLLHNLEELYKNLKLNQNGFSKRIETSIELLKELLVLIDKLFLPIKNLNQDLMTIKFLLANLKLSSSNSKSIDENLGMFNEVINDFKICSFQNESNLSSLKNQVKQALSNFEQIRSKNIHDLDTILNHIHYGIILFAEKHEESSRLIPEFTKKTENTSKSIAEIITNLQYQDIIRQKMEHIQATHKKVLADLEDYSHSENETQIEHQQNLKNRIRDIANLQSAQLVHANKEYQHAIEIITDKFLAIGNDMTTISSMCREFSSSHDNTEELHLQSLLAKIENSSNVMNSFMDAGKSFTNHTDILTSGISKTAAGFSRFSASNEKLKSASTKLIDSFTEAEKHEEILEKSIEHVKTLCDDVDKFENIIQRVFGLIDEKGRLLSSNIKQHLETVKEKGFFAVSAQNLNNISHQLTTKNERIQILLDENLDLSSSVSVDVKKSIEKIRYYDFFDKVIVDIIGELNQIYNKLKTDQPKEGGSEIEDLNKIKSLYTMASEHIIHDKVTSGEGDVDLFDEDEPKSDDDDNLELF